MTKQRKPKDEKYEKIANKIYSLIGDEDPTFGDIVAALELVKLWVYSDFTDMHTDKQNSNVDIIEVKG